MKGKGRGRETDALPSGSDAFPCGQAGKLEHLQCWPRRSTFPFSGEAPRGAPRGGPVFFWGSREQNKKEKLIKGSLRSCCFKSWVLCLVTKKQSQVAVVPSGRGKESPWAGRGWAPSAHVSHRAS